MAQILVTHGTSEGKTREICEDVARRITSRGHNVRLLPVEEATPRMVAAADGVFLGASVHVGRHKPSVSRFVRTAMSELDDRPTAFLSVSLHGARADGQEAAIGYVDSFLADTGWLPSLTATTGGALRYSRYGLLKRYMMKRIARRNGLPTDVSRDHDFTDEAEVATFADQLVALVTGAGIAAARLRSDRNRPCGDGEAAMTSRAVWR